MFRSLFHDYLQWSSFIPSAFTTFQLPASSFVFFGFVAICNLFVCVWCTCLCVVWSCLIINSTNEHRGGLIINSANEHRGDLIINSANEHIRGPDY
jgi:hypothetical protein